MSKKKQLWGSPPWKIAFRPKRYALPNHADFVVIGGGFAGLSAAAHLAKLATEKTVVVLESESIGNGASGRTGGMALAETAAGPLPKLGDVLAGYKKIIRALKIDARLHLPGAWELARHSPMKNSPIAWHDSGPLRVVRKVQGGTIDPGRVVSGLARAAEAAGVKIFEYAEVTRIYAAKGNNLSAPGKRKNRSTSTELQVRLPDGRREKTRTINAGQVLLATNGGSLNLSELRSHAETKLTLALATEPLTQSQLREIGLSARRPFYTIDYPYLWGRLLENDGVIFGAGLVPVPKDSDSLFTIKKPNKAPGLTFRDLAKFNVRAGVTADRMNWLESRVRSLHPALKRVRIIHRWGGPILITRDFRPVFRRHPHHPGVLILAGFSGHGVALSVYLGRHAAEVLLGSRNLPGWSR